MSPLTRTAAPVVALAAALSVLSVQPASADTSIDHLATAYRLTLLDPTNSGVASAALGVNDRGDVSGVTRPTSKARPQQTVLWTHDADGYAATELANLPGSTFSRGFDLNDDRTVVGEAFNQAGNSTPITWKNGQNPSQPTLNAAGSGVLYDVNDAGTSVGTASSTAVSVSAAGGVTTLPAPATADGDAISSYSAATIAEDGTVGGRAFFTDPASDDSVGYGVVWKAGRPSLLPAPDGTEYPTVTGVADGGTAVGSATSGSTSVAVQWSADGKPSTLQDPAITGFASTAANAVNDHGIAVGYASKYAGNYSFGGAAVGWDHGRPTQLSSLVQNLPAGVSLLSASDINDDGVIVGAASTPDGSRGFALTPVVSTRLTVGFSTPTIYAGEPVTLTASQDPATGLDQYRWFTRASADATWTPVDGADSARWTLTPTQSQDGRQVQARLYTHSGQEVAVSEPASLRVLAARSASTTTAYPSATVRGLPALVLVSVRSAGRQLPSGTVTVTAAGDITATARLFLGAAIVTLPGRLPAGRQPITITYSGDGATRSSSTTSTLVVLGR